MCQLTTPHPSFEQCWNWKLNVDAGLNLFAQKRGAALAYQGGRSYTEDQLNHEAVSRWNGGAYHEWDANAGEWVRKANVHCDSQTGNIGWDMNDPNNTGRSEADLHQRDRGGYSAGPAASSHWKGYASVTMIVAPPSTAPTTVTSSGPALGETLASRWASTTTRAPCASRQF
jgi:hypothetical protein